MTKATEPAKAQLPSHKGIPTKPQGEFEFGLLEGEGWLVGFGWLVGWMMGLLQGKKVKL